MLLGRVGWSCCDSEDADLLFLDGFGHVLAEAKGYIILEEQSRALV